MRVLLVDVPTDLATGLRERLGEDVTIDDLTTDLLDPSTTTGAHHDVVVHALGQGVSDEDRLLRSTLGTWNLLQPMSTGRYVQLSTMDVHDGYDDGWEVRELWLPRPATDATTLACHLGELTGRDLTRSRSVDTRVVRLDTVVGPQEWGDGPVPGEAAGRRWLHLDDAVAAIAVVVTATFPAAVRPSGPVTPRLGTWEPYHAVRGGGRYRLVGLSHLGFVPAHPCPDDTAVPAPRTPIRPAPLTDLSRPERITVYGAGGPMGVATTDRLLDREFVRATDRFDLAGLAGRPPQSPGAPVPHPLPAPHEFVAVDVTDGDQVRRAAEGSDCLVNVSVLRDDVPLAFRVNLIGAWHVMQAAIAEGIRRVVYTGPSLSIATFPFAHWDRALDGTQQFRGDDWVYLVTKMLGQEVTRLLAEEHGIAAPVLLWVGFTAPERVAGGGAAGHPNDFCVTWADTGLAMRAAIDVAALPEPSPVINILAPSPTDRWTTDRARDLLGWEASDDLEPYWWDSRASRPDESGALDQRQ